MFLIGRIRGFHTGGYKEFHLLGYNAMQSDKIPLMFLGYFQKNFPNRLSIMDKRLSGHKF
jgi:hypothetical protein